MKYTLFCGNNYYPRGGWEDFEGYFETLEEAKGFCLLKYANEDFEMWAHIVYENKIILYGSFLFDYDHVESYKIPCKWEWRDEE